MVVGVHEEVGRFSYGTGAVPELRFLSKPEDVGVPNRVALQEFMGWKRA